MVKKKRTPKAPEQDEAVLPTPLPPVVVDGHAYARFIIDRDLSVVVIPGVDGTDELPEVPQQAVPFAGVDVTVGVRVLQENRFVGNDGARQVVPLTSWGITLNGVLVYAPTDQPMAASIALLRASQALPRLLAHPVRWWDPSSWQGRKVWFMGLPATVEDFRPERGQALLRAEQGFSFPPPVADLEAGVGPLKGPSTALVDILSPSITWTRTRIFSQEISDEPGEADLHPMRNQADLDAAPRTEVGP